LSGLKPKPGDDGIRRFVVPAGEGKLPMVSVVDIGKAAAYCLHETVVDEFCIASDILTG
jgi:hypothetical protein